jgi:hypothetical protein
LIFAEEHMATIVIKDLSENADLDRKAMRAITGGSRLRSGAGGLAQQPQRAKRIVDFRAAPARKPVAR